MDGLNPDMQPSRNFTIKRVQDRDINVLIGICIGVLSDGSINTVEAEFLKGWLKVNRHIRDQWPADIIFEKLNQVFEDGVMDEQEEKELLGLLVKVVGGKHDETTGENATIDLPYEEPQPELDFTDAMVCMTGKFEIGSRKDIQEIVETLGGKIVKDPSRNTTYLLVGSVGSRDWQFKSFGRKIQKAIDLKNKELPIMIIHEKTLAEYLQSALAVQE